MTNHSSAFLPTLVFWEIKKRKFAVCMCSLRITLCLEVEIFGGITHVTQVLQWTLAGYSRQTKQNKSGELLLHRKDQPYILEISCRQEDRSVNLMV